MTWLHTSIARGDPKLAPPLVKERGESRLVKFGKLLARNCWQLADSKLAASLGFDPDRKSWLDSSGCFGSGSLPMGTPESLRSLRPWALSKRPGQVGGIRFRPAAVDGGTAPAVGAAAGIGSMAFGL